MERPLLLPNDNTVNEAKKKTSFSLNLLHPYLFLAQVSEGEVTSPFDNGEDWKFYVLIFSFQYVVLYKVFDMRPVISKSK